MKRYLILAALALPVIACADMTPTQQRAVSGTAIGAGAGLLGGLLVDRSRQAQDTAFQQGLAAGRQGQ